MSTTTAGAAADSVVKTDVGGGENLVRTEKGALAHATTTSARLDFFFNTVRRVNEERLFSMVEASWAESPLDTLKIIFYIRDCRGGKGERLVFRQCFRWLIDNGHAKQVLANLNLVSEYGRWEDLLWFLEMPSSTEGAVSDEKIGASKEVSAAVAKMFAQQLREDEANMQEGKPVSLCAKWAPTEKGKHDRKFGAVALLCRELGIDKKTYRTKYLGPLREYLKVVERLMCLKRWEEIDYNKVPSLAMNRLKKAFAKNDPERFAEWQEKLKRGDETAKVNASVIDPHTLVGQYMNFNAEENTVIEEQWKEIMLRVAEMGSLKKSLVLSDVSGSMYGDPMIVSIALGILISTVTMPPYQNLVLTFESTPQFFELKGNTLLEQVRCLAAAPWGGSTNLGLAFDLILDMAKKNNVPQEDMPDKLFIISDMEFDIIEGYGQSMTSLDAVRAKFRDAGYEMPKIVFWNVRASTGGAPATSTDNDVALISGYSPSVMKAVLDGKTDDFTPYSIMRTAIDDKRYDAIKYVE